MRFTVLLLALWLGACSTLNAVNSAANTPVTQTEINNAKAASFALESGYDATLTVAIAWARLPRCGVTTSASPVCSTASGVLAIEKIRVNTRTALDAFNAAIAGTTTSSSQLTAAMAAAQQAYGAYKQIVNTMKGS